jgi:hypothetical protein
VAAASNPSRWAKRAFASLSNEVGNVLLVAATVGTFESDVPRHVSDAKVNPDGSIGVTPEFTFLLSGT